MLPAPRSPDGRTIREDHPIPAEPGGTTSIMPVTNAIERLNEEIKRDTHVVRIFPNAASCLRLIRAVAVEMHENWSEAHRRLNMDDLREHKKEVLRMAAILACGQRCALPTRPHHRHHDPFCRRFWAQLQQSLTRISAPAADRAKLRPTKRHRWHDSVGQDRPWESVLKE
jgi:hypothetical protein